MVKCECIAISCERGELLHHESAQLHPIKKEMLMMKVMLTSKFYRIALLALIIMLASSTAAFAANESEPNNFKGTADNANPLESHYGAVGGADIDFWRLHPRAYIMEFINSGTEAMNIQIILTLSGIDYVLYSNSSFSPGSQFINFDPTPYPGASDIYLRVNTASFSTQNYSFRYNNYL